MGIQALRDEEKALGKKYDSLSVVIDIAQMNLKPFFNEQQEIAERLFAIDQEIKAFEMKSQMINDLMTIADELASISSRLNGIARIIGTPSGTPVPDLNKRYAQAPESVSIPVEDEGGLRDADPEDYSAPATIGDLHALRHEILEAIEKLNANNVAYAPS